MTKKLKARFGRGQKLFIVLVLLGAPLLTGASVATNGLHQTVKGFYDLALKLHSLGVPNATNQAKMRPFLSSALQRQLRQALAAENRYAQKNRNQVPPLVESDLFSSLFEGASDFNVVSCDAQAQIGSCKVEFTHRDTGKNDAMKWQDRIHLVRETRGWLIDDIEYLGDWQFMHKGRLKTLLHDVIAESKT